MRNDEIKANIYTDDLPRNTKKIQIFITTNNYFLLFLNRRFISESCVQSRKLTIFLFSGSIEESNNIFLCVKMKISRLDDCYSPFLMASVQIHFAQQSKLFNRRGFYIEIHS